MQSRYYFRQSFENCSNLQQLEHSAIGFTFASDWLKNCREIFNQITDRSNRNRVITFDSHLETSLRSQIAVPIETVAPSRFTKVPKLFGRILGDLTLRVTLQNEGVSRHETLHMF